MNLIQSISTGIMEGFKYRRIAGYILFIQILLSALVGVLSFNYIQESVGRSMNLYKIIDGYNHDVFQDLLRFESTGWTMIKSFAVVVVILYLIIGPFIMGGLLSAFKEGRDGWNVFWRGGSKFYKRFLKVNALILLVFAFNALIFGLLARFITNYGLNNFKSEVPILVCWGLIGLLLLVCIILLVSASTLAKIEIMKHEVSPWRAFRSGFKNTGKNVFKYLVLGFTFLGISILFSFLANTLINSISESGFLLVLLALILQIFTLFIRVCFRNGYYNSIINLS